MKISQEIAMKSHDLFAGRSVNHIGEKNCLFLGAMYKIRLPFAIGSLEKGDSPWNGEMSQSDKGDGSVRAGSRRLTEGFLP